MTAIKGSLNPIDQLDKDDMMELILETLKLEDGLERLQFNQIDLNHQNSRGWCLLFEAASSLPTTKLEEILDSGVLINIRDFKGRNALFWALYTGNSSAATILIKRGIDYCSHLVEGISSLHYSIFKNDFEVLKILCEFMDINIQDNQGSTPLMCAAFYDREQMVEHLIQKGAHLSQVDKEGQNMLDYAISGKSMKALKMMQQLGVLDDVLYQNSNFTKES
ncbi:MAG: ankyrin repeat domain-containing protein [Epsilonproteobacteria bacterium]|nr:ankyrin repeat domain-containing protein [Campylobacterota bacterium]